MLEELRTQRESSKGFYFLFLFAVGTQKGGARACVLVWLSSLSQLRLSLLIPAVMISLWCY